MVKKCSKFVTEFLIPSLNSERFGNHLKWLDRENYIFQLGWLHKAVPHWSEEEAQVFVEWDKIKGHYQPNEKKYLIISKQRFRALLNKLSQQGQIRKIKSDKKSKKVYSITGVKNLQRKRHSSNADSNTLSTDFKSSANNKLPSQDANGDEVNKLCNVTSKINNLDDHNYSQCLIDNSAKKHRKEHRKENGKSIPTPVTCRHASLVPRPSSHEESYSSSSSPEYCVTYEGFDETDLELSYEYYRALNASYDKRMQGTDLSKSAIQTLNIERVVEDGG